MHQAGAIISARKGPPPTRVLTSVCAVEPSREVPVARVWEDRDDDPLVDRGGQPAHGPERGAAGMSDQNAFGPRDRPCQVIGRLGRASPDLVCEGSIPDP